jgi:hypothetical protein
MSHNIKLSYRVLHTMGLKSHSDNAAFDAAHYRHTYLSNFVDELKNCLESYVVQVSLHA